MNDTLAAMTVSDLRRMTPARADAKLCSMPSEHLFALADVLDLRLPQFGGDKPALIVGALFKREG